MKDYNLSALSKERILSIYEYFKTLPNRAKLQKTYPDIFNLFNTGRPKQELVKDLVTIMSNGSYFKKKGGQHMRFKFDGPDDKVFAGIYYESGGVQKRATDEEIVGLIHHSNPIQMNNYRGEVKSLKHDLDSMERYRLSMETEKQGEEGLYHKYKTYGIDSMSNRIAKEVDEIDYELTHLMVSLADAEKLPLKEANEMEKRYNYLESKREELLKDLESATKHSEARLELAKNYEKALAEAPNKKSEIKRMEKEIVEYEKEVIEEKNKANFEHKNVTEKIQEQREAHDEYKLATPEGIDYFNALFARENKKPSEVNLKDFKQSLERKAETHSHLAPFRNALLNVYSKNDRFQTNHGRKMVDYLDKMDYNKKISNSLIKSYENLLSRY